MKKLLFLALILAISYIGNVFWQESQVHVKVQELSLNSNLYNKAMSNEAKLYAKREELDPAFYKAHVFPISSLEIDVIIPITESDLETVVYTIESLRKLVNHKINKIYLIGPNQERIKDFAITYKCEYVDEDQILPTPEIKKFGNWVLQQFIKLNADQVVTKDHYLVIDPDTIFLRPMIFYTKDTYLINVQWDFGILRKKITSKFLNNQNIYLYDFVTHHMLFSKNILQQMKNHIETVHKDQWYKVFLKEFAKDQLNRRGFSEYELYATYLTEFTKEKYIFTSNANISIPRNFLGCIDKIIQAYAHQYKTINVRNDI